MEYVSSYRNTIFVLSLSLSSTEMVIWNFSTVLYIVLLQGTAEVRLFLTQNLPCHSLQPWHDDCKSFFFQTHTLHKHTEPIYVWYKMTEKCPFQLLDYLKQWQKHKIITSADILFSYAWEHHKSTRQNTHKFSKHLEYTHKCLKLHLNNISK
jgi:hypothetical protein